MVTLADAVIIFALRAACLVFHQRYVIRRVAGPRRVCPGTRLASLLEACQSTECVMRRSWNGMCAQFPRRLVCLKLAVYSGLIDVDHPSPERRDASSKASSSERLFWYRAMASHYPNHHVYPSKSVRSSSKNMPVQRTTINPRLRVLSRLDLTQEPPSRTPYEPYCTAHLLRFRRLGPKR